MRVLRLFSLFLIGFTLQTISTSFANDVRPVFYFTFGPLGCDLVIEVPPVSGAVKAFTAYAPFDKPNETKRIDPDRSRVFLIPDRYLFTVIILFEDGALSQPQQYPHTCYSIATFRQQCDLQGNASIRYVVEGTATNLIDSVYIKSNKQEIERHTNINNTRYTGSIAFSGLRPGTITNVEIFVQGQYDDDPSRVVVPLTCPAPPPTRAPFTPIPPTSVPPTAEPPTALPPPPPTDVPPTDVLPTPTEPVVETTVAAPVIVDEHFTCPAGTTPYVLFGAPQIIHVEDPVRSAAFTLPADSPNGVLLVASAVGHPEDGCPGSGAETCGQAQDNEEFNVAIDGTGVASVPDHGEDQWQVFSFAYALTAGSHEASFSHTGNLGSSGSLGSVSIKAVYCAG
jgi:hypothetical protein